MVKMVMGMGDGLTGRLTHEGTSTPVNKLVSRIIQFYKSLNCSSNMFFNEMGSNN